MLSFNSFTKMQWTNVTLGRHIEQWNLRQSITDYIIVINVFPSYLDIICMKFKYIDFHMSRTNDILNQIVKERFRNKGWIARDGEYIDKISRYRQFFNALNSEMHTHC